ncbi:ester cyclase [Nonomuraea zeae]|uniref:Ester cyclase n=1 Tax=Nonomuraea zeae TaxID=1642303 RepID=A0A5S4GFB4_9ACTN|nr:ester cyclase [Nonomuraea zeae]TMR31656.1 ester cyclase [Nonomuraea zeae]
MTDLRELQRAVQQAWSGQRWDAWRATCADGYTFDPGIGVPLDLEQTMLWNIATFTAFPDFSEVVRHVYIDGNTVITEVLGQGGSAGEFRLFGSTLIPATGRRFELSYVKVLVFDERGLVIEDRQYQDWGSVRAQLGAV